MLINNRLSSSITHQQAAEHIEINIQKRYATTCQVVQYNIHIKVVFPFLPITSNCHASIQLMYEENIFENKKPHVVKYITEAKKKRCKLL